jgi:hypothetical protein
MTGKPKRHTLTLAVAVLVAMALPFLASAADAPPVELQIQALRAELAETAGRLKALESQLGAIAAESKATRDTLTRELSQPMLLLVGEGRCPAGFERISVEAMLLTGPRTPKNIELIERAGLADEEQQGVGSRVFRYLDFCFRAANSVTVK